MNVNPVVLVQLKTLKILAKRCKALRPHLKKKIEKINIFKVKKEEIQTLLDEVKESLK